MRGSTKEQAQAEVRHIKTMIDSHDRTTTHYDPKRELTMRQVEVLVDVAEHPGTYSSAVAKRLGRDSPSNMSQEVWLLVRRGLMTQEGSYRKPLHLTDEGRRKLDDLLGTYAELYARYLRAHDPRPVNPNLPCLTCGMPISEDRIPECGPCQASRTVTVVEGACVHGTPFFTTCAACVRENAHFRQVEAMRRPRP